MLTTTRTTQTTHLRHWHDKRTEKNDIMLPMDWNWSMTTDLHYLGLTANYITAKLTNQFVRTGLRTFEWQQIFTWLWRCFPLRLTKHQSPLPTTVLHRTTLTRITRHYTGKCCRYQTPGNPLPDSSPIYPQLKKRASCISWWCSYSKCWCQAA